MNENEIWLPIEGYENYQVSNIGKIKSLNYNHTKQEKILRQRQNKHGYMQVVLYKDGKMKTYLVHRLVASSFLDNPNNYTCVNHKDENKTNNCVDNLEWCTTKYNVNYGTGIKRRADTQKNNHRSKKVYQYDKQGNLIKIWESTRECNRQGYKQSAISACCRGEFKHYKNYIWSYIPL